MARLLLCERGVAGSEMNLRERRDGLRRVRVRSDLERGREGALQVVDGLVGLSEEEGQAAEVVEEPADALAIGHLLVQRLRALGVGASQHPLALPLGHERSLEVDVRDRLAVAEALGQLQRAVDVLPGRHPVALSPVAAGAPFEDVRAKPIAGQARALRQPQCLAEQISRRADRRQLVAAAAEPVENLGPIEVREA